MTRRRRYSSFYPTLSSPASFETLRLRTRGSSAPLHPLNATQRRDDTTVPLRMFLPPPSLSLLSFTPPLTFLGPRPPNASPPTPWVLETTV